MPYKDPEKQRQAVRDWAKRNPDKVLASWRKYRQENPERVREAGRRYSKSHPEKMREKVRKFRKNNPTSYLKSQNKWNGNHQRARRSEWVLQAAIRRGKIVRPSLCSICNVSCRAHGHHPDYEKPLEVLWVCAKCHKTLPLGENP